MKTMRVIFIYGESAGGPRVGEPNDLALVSQIDDCPDLRSVSVLVDYEEALGPVEDVGVANEASATDDPAILEPEQRAWRVAAEPVHEQLEQEGIVEGAALADHELQRERRREAGLLAAGQVVLVLDDAEDPAEQPWPPAAVIVVPVVLEGCSDALDLGFMEAPLA